MKAKTITLRAPRVLAGAMLVAGMIVGNLAAMPSASAANGEAIWDGDAGDFKFSSAANWEGDTLPVAGDVLKFSKATSDERREFTVDIDTTFGGMVLTGDSSSDYDTFSGNVMKFVADADLSSDYQSILGGVTGLGNLSMSNFVMTGLDFTVNGTLMAKSVVFSGSIIGQDINAYKLINTRASFNWGGGSHTSTFSKPITLGSGGVLSLMEGRTLTIDSLTLESDAQVQVGNGSKLIIKNLTSNGHKLTRTSDSLGTLETSDGVSETVFDKKTTKLDGDKPTEEYDVVKNETAILSGTRQYINVYNGGILKGDGTVDYLQIQAGGVVAPGNSPGVLTVLQYLNLSSGSTYQAEIKNPQEYDKIVIRDSDYANASIADSILDLSLLDGADIKKGDTFTIIDFQRAGEAINGTFKDLPEGTKIVVGDAVFSISYKGGDGNDVVLTALNDATTPAPGTPNTGAMELVRSNPAVVAIAGIVAAVALLVIKRRQTQR